MSIVAGGGHPLVVSFMWLQFRRGVPHRERQVSDSKLPGGWLGEMLHHASYVLASAASCRS